MLFPPVAKWDDTQVMRIVAVSHASWVGNDGGVERVLKKNLPELAGRGHDVTLVHGTHEARPSVEVVDRGQVAGTRQVAVYRDDSFFHVHTRVWHPAVRGAIRSLIDRLRPDVVHIHHWVNLTSDLVGVATEARVPSVVSLHDAWTTCPRGFRVDRNGHACSRPIDPASCRACVPVFPHQTAAQIDESIALHRSRMAVELAMTNRVLVADDSLRELVQSKLSPSGVQFETLPLVSGWRDQGRQFSPAGKPFRFGWWGVAAPHKGIGDLLDAFEIVWKQRPVDVELHVLGPFVDDTLEQRAADLIAAGAPLQLHGKFDQHELAALDIDAAVLPSRAYESWSLTLDEAFSMAVPVIVSDFGAPARRIGEAGLVVPPGSPIALAEAMMRLLDSPGLCAELVASRSAPTVDGRQEAEAGRYVDRLERIYRDVVAEGPRPARGRELEARAKALREASLAADPGAPPA